LIVAGWNGSPKTVIVRVADNLKNDIVTIYSATGTQLAALGSVQLGGDYTDNQVILFGSTMTLSGNVVTVLLGTPYGRAIDERKAGTMVWTAPSGAATESGPADNEF